MYFRGTRLGAAVLVAGLWTASARAQFGTEDQAFTLLGPADFVSENGTARTSTNFPHLRWSDDGEYLIASLNGIPNGSRITKIVYYFRDEDPGQNLELKFSEVYFDGASGAPLGQFNIGIQYPGGDSGDTYVVDNHVHPIQYQLDSNGVPEIHQYAILVRTPAGNATTAIRSVLVRWQRQVSPAPLAATFGDVPTNHQFFQFIEALSDSGITAGCRPTPRSSAPIAR